MKEVNHIFFDLDHTLWDYDRSAKETLEEIYKEVQGEKILPFKKFIKNYHEVNDHLWHQYNHSLIDRDYIKNYRFEKVFEKSGLDDSKARDSSEYFMKHCSTKPYLIPFAKAALDYLEKKYRLHIITNGFNDVQPIKLKSSGIEDYFEVLITSETSGAKKPSPEIFQQALEMASAGKHESVMIGDNPKTDIHGAREYGIRTILFDPSQTKRSMADHSIASLDELIHIF